MKNNYVVTEKMVKRLRKIGVAVVYLFGSKAEGTDSPISDIDLGILMEKPKAVSFNTSTLDLYNNLYDIFSGTEFICGSNLDLVFLERASLELKKNVVFYGKVIYDNNPKKRLDFEDETVILSADFLPILNQFDRAVLSKI